MVVSEMPKVKIQVDGRAGIEELEQVSKWVYLGELITETGMCEEEILRGI